MLPFVVDHVGLNRIGLLVFDFALRLVGVDERLDVIGLTGSVLDFNEKSGFYLSNATQLGFVNLAAQNASDNLITVDNELASVTLTDSTLTGRIEGNVAFTLTASGANTVEGGIMNAVIDNSGILTLTSGTTPSVLEGTSVAGSGSLIIAGNVSLTDGSTIEQAVQITSAGSLMSEAEALETDVANEGLLTLTGGTLDTAVTGAGTLQIAGDTTPTSAATIVQDTLTLTQGTFDLSNITDDSGNIDFTDPTSPVQIGMILAKGGRLNFQDGKTGLITFGTIDTTGEYTDNLKLGIGIDLDLTHEDMKADLLKINGDYGLIQEGSIVIDSINLLTEWPSELGVAIKISNDQIAGLLNVANNALVGSNENLLLTIEDIADDPEDVDSPIRTYMRLDVSNPADVIRYYAPIKNYTLSEDVVVTKAEQDAIIEAYIASLDDPSSYDPDMYNPATDQMGYSMTISGSDSADDHHSISAGSDAPETYIRLYSNTQVLRIVNTDITGFVTPIINKECGNLDFENVNITGTVINGAYPHSIRGRLYLDGENVIENVAGSEWGAGDTVVRSGTTTLTGSLTQSYLIVGDETTGEDATFVNEGDVTVTEVRVVTEDSVLDNTVSGTIAADLITNIGRIDNLGTMSGSVENADTGRIFTDADKIATGENDTITNEGTIVFTGGTLSKDIEAATGTEAKIVIAGEVDFASETTVAQEVQISEGALLTATGESLAADLQNEGDLAITGGTLAANVSGTGTTQIIGNVVLDTEKTIAQNISVAQGMTFSASASGLRGDIETTGTLEVSDGVLSRAITGSGLVLVNGTVVNLGTIDTEVSVADGWLYSHSESLSQPVTLAQDTHLFLGGSVFTNTVNGNGTIHFLEDALWEGAQVSSGTSVHVEPEVSLDIDGNRITINELLLDGNLKIGISELTSNSSEYVGGHVSVSHLEIGDDAKLFLKVNPGLLTSGTGETDGLVLIDENGEPAQASFDVGSIIINTPYAVSVESDGTYRIRNLNQSFDFEGSANNHRTATAWMNAVFDADSLGEAAQDALIVLQNTDTEAYAETLADIAPDDSAAGVALASANFGRISQQVAGRLAAVSAAPRGASGKDGFLKQDLYAMLASQTRGSTLSRNLWSDALALQNHGIVNRNLWATALHGYARDKGNAEHAGFKMHSSSVMVGGDGEIAPGFTLGLGYAYDRSKVRSGAHKTNADSHNAFIYGQYEDDGYYIQGLFGLGTTRMKDTSEILGIANQFRHTDDNLNATITVGKRFDVGLTLRSGFKWMHLDRGGYTDAFGQSVDNASMNVTTLSAGADFAKTLPVDNGALSFMTFATMNYDVGASAARSVVTVGSTSYLIEGKKLKPFGVDAGASLAYKKDSWYFSLEYQCTAKGKYRSHTGMLTAKKTF